MTPHRTCIYQSDGGAQIAVEVWPEGIDVKVKPAADAIWGLPLQLVRVEGSPVQFAFEEEEIEPPSGFKDSRGVEY